MAEGDALFRPTLSDYPHAHSPRTGTGRSRLAARHQHCQDRLEVIVGEFFELVVGAVLHRVGNKHQCRVDAERFGLRRGPFDEFGGGDADGWNAARFGSHQMLRGADR